MDKFSKSTYKRTKKIIQFSIDKHQSPDEVLDLSIEAQNNKLIKVLRINYHPSNFQEFL
jgi:hypothetical protein